MRPNDVIYSHDPEMDPGLLSLRAQLGGRGRGASLHALGPIAALTEVQAICRSMLRGRGGPNKANRDSLVRDVGRSLDQIGAETKTALGAALTAFRKEIGTIAIRLETPQGARALDLSVEHLLRRFEEGDVLIGVWRDVVDAFLRHNSAAELGEQRIRQLVELVEHRGVDWDQRRKALEYLLSDDARTLARFGEVEPPDLDDDGPGGVSVDRRLRLCEHALTAPRFKTDIPVWLVINNAAINLYLRVGPVQFFDEGIWPEAVKPGQWSGAPADFDPLPEFADWDEAQVWFAHLPPAEHRVYARVMVKNSDGVHARDHAREVLGSMIDLAEAHTSWVLLDGAFSWTERGGWSGSTYSLPMSPAELMAPPHPVFEPTGEGLSLFDPGFVERLVAGDHDALEAVDDALWSVAVERAPTIEQRMILAARAIERTLSQARAIGDDSWAVAAGRYLEALWVEAQLVRDLADACAAAQWALTTRDRQSDRYQDLRAKLYPSEGPGRTRPSRTGLVEVGPEVVEITGPGYVEHRIVAEALEVLIDPSAGLSLITSLRARFDALLSRSARQRNAIIHGTGTSRAALVSVDGFMAMLTRFVAKEAMRQAETGEAPLAELERRRVALFDIEAELENGTSLIEVFG